MMLHEHPRLTGTHRRILAFCWLGWTLDFYVLMLWSFISKAVQADLKITGDQAGLILGLSLGATGVGGAVFGWLADLYGRRRIQQAAILCYAAGVLATGFSQGFGHLVAARLLTGFGVGGQWASAHALVGETFPAAIRGRVGAVLQTGTPLGWGLAVIVGGFLVPKIGWRAACALSALSGLTAVALQVAVPESDVWERDRAAGAGRRDRAARLLGPGLRWTFLLAFVLTVLNMSNYWIAFSLFPRFLSEERALSERFTLAVILGSLAGYLSYGFVSDRIGRKPSFAIYSGILAAGLLMLTVFFEAVRGRPALFVALMVVAGFGTGTWSNFGPFLAELFPTAVRNTAMGFVMNVARGIQFLAPVAVLLMKGRYGLSGGIALAALFAALAGAWVWLLPETRGRDLGVE
jgi:MFS family permease